MSREFHTLLRRSVEPRYVAEWVQANYPSDEVHYQYPLGPVSQDLVAKYGEYKGTRMSRPNRVKVDALIFKGRKLILVEGKVWNPFNGLGTLRNYRDLVPYTPELRLYADRPVICFLVTPWPLYWKEALAAAADIRIEYYLPEWLVPYKEEYNNRYTAQGRQETARRKEILSKVFPEAGLNLS
jgi:hypothetical protein